MGSSPWGGFSLCLGSLSSPFVQSFIYSAASVGVPAIYQALLGPGDKNRCASVFPSPSFLGHRHWVLSISWSPDGKKLASGCKNGQVDGGQGN